ncbi:MAG: TRAP transporter small permease subunit [Pseudomonadota bacterium]
MSRALERLAALWAIVGGAILLLIVAVTVTNVAAFGLDRIARLWGGTVSGLPGYEDFVALAMGAAAPMLLPYCQAKRGHLAVDLLMSAAPEAVRRAIDAVALALTAAAALFLAYWMFFGMLETRDDGVLSRVLGWPEWPFYAPGVLSLLLWAAVAIGQIGALEPRDEADHG